MCIRDSLETGHLVVEALALAAFAADEVAGRDEPVLERHFVGAVSYTHLTLPTSDLV